MKFFKVLAPMTLVVGLFAGCSSDNTTPVVSDPVVTPSVSQAASASQLPSGSRANENATTTVNGLNANTAQKLCKTVFDQKMKSHGNAVLNLSETRYGGKSGSGAGEGWSFFIGYTGNYGDTTGNAACFVTGTEKKPVVSKLIADGSDGTSITLI